MKRDPPTTSSSKKRPPLLLRQEESNIGPDDELDDDPDDDDADRYGFDVSPDGDDDRYASARGWEPPDPFKKAREKARLDNPEIYCTDSLLEVRPAGDWLSAAQARPAAAKLFGDLWQVGELAILFADLGLFGLVSLVFPGQ